MATAYAALVSLFNDLELIPNHPIHSFSFDNNQIQSLLEMVCFLMDFMETCDYQGAADAEGLEKKIAVAAHAAGDVILSHVSDQIRSGSTLKKETRPPRFLLDLQKAIEDMEFVKRKAIDVQKLQTTPSPPSSAAASTSTPLPSQKNTMVGFDEVLHQLLDLLTREAGRRVISITGMGGLGKTTLARNAFQHKLVVEHFDVCLWATISQEYDVEGILKQLLGSKSSGGSVVELGKRLYQSLFGRRYLIVLDDMWSSEAWDEIRFYFPEHNDNQSRIIVTSRQSHLADYLSSPRFPLDLLDEDNGWNLFCEKAFVDKEGCPPELEIVGRKIVKKCRGLPLAIVVVGGHLRNSLRTQEYWENVANHMDSILSSDVDEPCLDILCLSYNYLPVHLKPCFLYMGILKEDQRIDASRLIKLWIGEGFIKSNKTQSLEEAAEGFLNDLVDRNLILACERNLDGKIESCELHDIVRELCLKIAGKEKFICVLDTLIAVHRERRVVVPSSGRIGEPRIHSLRVLNAVNGDFLEVGCHRFNLRHLGCTLSRSIDISSSIYLLWSLQTLIVDEPIELPYEFWEMPQLRHLIGYKGIRVPSDCGRLVQGNLQTLLGVENLRLSEEVCMRITHIKELRIDYTDFECMLDEAYLLYYPQNLNLLHELELLTIEMPVTKKVVLELGVDDEIQKKKALDAVYSVFGIEEAHMDMITKQLTAFGDFDTAVIVENLKKTFPAEVIVGTVKVFFPCHGFGQSFKFPNSLKNLSLHGTYLYWEELSMMVGSLPFLETLHLEANAVIGSEWNTIEGHFDHLKSLIICNCEGLVNFNVDSSHFLALRHLVLWRLPKLDEIPSSIGELPSLQLIRLSNCSVSLAMSAMRILVEQEQDYGNEGLQLQVDFWNYDKKKNFKEKLQEEGLKSNNLCLV